MDYHYHYNVLIERSKDREIIEYTEKHHIVPKCMGGSNDKANITKLSAREHFVAHQLLVKMYPNELGLICALYYMTNKSNINRNTNRTYAWHRNKHKENMSIIQSGESNSQYGTRWIYNNELKLSKKIPKTDELPTEWNEGRRLKFDDVIVVCDECGREFKQQTTERFCSSRCRTYNRAPYIKLINDNKKYLIAQFIINKSIAKTLREFGIVGEKIGNSYFSKILKEHDIDVLRRRNTMPL